MQINTYNPIDNSPLESYSIWSDSQVVSTLNDCHSAFIGWRDKPMAERVVYLRAIGRILQNQKANLALLICREMGKPLTQADAEIDKCALLCEYYATNGPGFLADEPVPSKEHAYVSFLPMGVILGVMPWNFPFWQVFRFAIPSLLAGNGCVLKHASNVTGCALAIEQLMVKAGLPANIFRTLVIDSKQVELVINHPKVRAVTLTGSEGAGRAVASAAGRALKKSVLELGGSDPYLILEDADIENAARLCCNSRLLNSGQSCIGAKRFIVVEAVKPAFEEALVRHMAAAKVGDPMEEDTQVGPLARVDLRESLHQQVVASVGRGARLLLGGNMPDGAGCFYPPTVLTDVTPDCVAFHEELFGPVAAIISVADENEAIAVANDSDFGLGSAVFTKDVARGNAIALRLETGCSAINDFVRSDPALPFGGVKNSGYGRELSHYGIREFVNIKTIVSG